MTEPNVKPGLVRFVPDSSFRNVIAAVVLVFVTIAGTIGTLQWLGIVMDRSLIAEYATLVEQQRATDERVRTFDSWGRHNRICGQCKSTKEWRSGNDDMGVAL